MSGERKRIFRRPLEDSGFEFLRRIGGSDRKEKTMNVIFTCGGTAGHVNPAIALAGLMQERDPSVKVLFVGSQRGPEGKWIEKAGYPFRAVEIDNFRRSFKPADIKHNLHTAALVVKTPKQAKAVLREFQPDLIVGTGGYASYPLVKYGAKAGVPTAVHESNMVPGLTTKTLEPLVRKVMVGFEACRQYYAHPDKVVVTGTPVRGEFFKLTREQAREKLGIQGEQPLVVSFWGSLGASHMNEQMVDFIRTELAAGAPFRHIHAVGASGYPKMTEVLAAAGVDLADTGVEVREYIYDMPTVMRAADLVICRGGASTISEVTALGIPAIIVPSPYVVNNHQEKNASLLEQAGGIRMLREAESTGEKLYRAAMEILNSAETREKMHAALLELAVPDATERIYRTVMGILDETDKKSE